MRQSACRFAAAERARLNGAQKSAPRVFLAGIVGGSVVPVWLRADRHRVRDQLPAALAGYHLLSQGGWDANRLAVGGDSSGGNLATVVARRARDRALPLRLQLLVYPALDLWAPVGGPSDEYRYWVEAYLGPKGDANQPDVSPLRAADLRGVAAAVILSCGLDPLRKQADAYAQRLQEAGVPVKHHVFEGMIHGAFRMPAALEGARDMLATSAAALGRAFNLSR